MNNYVILTDSGCDLDAQLRNEYNIEYVNMSYTIDGEVYPADLDWKKLSAKEFYDLMRQGKRVYSSQVNKELYKEFFTKCAAMGKDVLYIGCSSALSASIKAAYVARDEVTKEYPNVKIICIDALRACFALGLLCIRASELRKEGKSIEEVALWLEENKLTVNMEGTVESLKYLKQAGRVSATSAFFGGLLNIKPIIIADALGQNYAIAKVKGRKTSFETIAKHVKENILDLDYQKIFISHADCYDDAILFRDTILSELGKDIDVHIGYVGPGVGSAVGPGMLGVYFFGKKVTINQGE